jgi:hypothetical protein
MYCMLKIESPRVNGERLKAKPVANLKRGQSAEYLKDKELNKQN